MWNTTGSRGPTSGIVRQKASALRQSWNSSWWASGETFTRAGRMPLLSEARSGIDGRRDIETDVVVKPAVTFAADAELTGRLAGERIIRAMREVRQDSLILTVILARRSVRGDAVLRGRTHLPGH